MVKKVNNCIKRVVTVVICRKSNLGGISPVTNHHISKEQSTSEDTTIPITVKIVKKANNLVVI